MHPTCGPTQPDDIPGIVRYSETYTRQCYIPVYLLLSLTLASYKHHSSNCFLYRIYLPSPLSVPPFIHHLSFKPCPSLSSLPPTPLTPYLSPLPPHPLPHASHPFPLIPIPPDTRPTRCSRNRPTTHASTGPISLTPCTWPDPEVRTALCGVRSPVCVWEFHSFIVFF